MRPYLYTIIIPLRYPPMQSDLLAARLIFRGLFPCL